MNRASWSIAGSLMLLGLGGASIGGCSQNDLKSTGGNGLFYCFATK